MEITLLLLTAAIHGLALSQGATVKSQNDVDDEQSRFAAALAMSSIWPEHLYDSVHLKRQRRDLEIDETGEATKTVEGPEKGEGEEDPPETGLRRWVIRVRNFMFGRGDLENRSANGEEEGEPPSGQSWMESLANWFTHGIRRVLVRISGRGEGEEGEEEVPETSAVPSSTTSARPWTALPPANHPIAPQATAAGSAASDDSTPVVSDEALEAKKAYISHAASVDETNEIN